MTSRNSQRNRHVRNRHLRVESLQSRRLLAADLAVATTSATPTNLPREMIRVDVNRDGYLSPIDALQVINVLNGSTCFEDNPFTDIDLNGEVTVDDVDAVFSAFEETEPRLGVLNYTPERFESQSTAPMQSGVSYSPSSSNYGTSSSSYSPSSSPTSTSTDTPEVISVVYKSESGNQIVAINEGAILPVSGTVKYGREVPSVEVAFWADVNFNGVKDSAEVATIQAIRNSQDSLSGDYFYVFNTSFLVLDDGPSPGNGTPVDVLNIRATPLGGTTYNSFMLVQNVAPSWVDYPTLAASYNEYGVIESASISGIFQDSGLLDRHGVQVFVNGVLRTEQLTPEYRTGFSVDLGVLTPNDGEKITINLLDDDQGVTTFYITLATVVSKSFIANIYTANGTGKVRAADPSDQNYAMSATNRLLYFGAATAAQFRENPGPLTEDDFRLYSRDIYAVGFDGGAVRYFEHVTEGSILRGGVEAFGYQGEIEERNRYTSQASQVSGIAGVFVFGRPDPSLESGFDSVMERNSTDIWYKLDVKFVMMGNFADFSVVATDSSAFPSNRVWIDTILETDYQQGTMVKLWQSSPTLGGAFVVGRSEIGIFERQYYLDDHFWMPVEN